MLGFWVVALGGVAGALAASPATVTAVHRRAAILTADRMLDAVVLPADAHRGKPRLTGGTQGLRDPIERLFFAAQVARHRFFGDRLVAIEAVAVGGQRSVVRADAYVRYVVPRPPAQRVPRRAQRLDITIADGSGRRPESIAVTREAAIRRIAAAIDGLPFAGTFPGIAFSCPAYTSTTPVDTFVFRASRAGPALASMTVLSRASTTAGPCQESPLRIRGRRAGYLMDGGVVIRAADHALGVRLDGASGARAATG